MLRFRKLLISVFFVSIFASGMSSYAENEIEDLIDIVETTRQIIAIIEGEKTISIRLHTDEKLLWSGSKGYLGAFLTNRRFSVISTSSPTWKTLPLGSEESEKGTASLSAYIALLVTEDRAIGFDAASNRFIEARLPIQDELLAAEAERYVDVVITSSRAFALAIESAAFIEIILGIGESIEEIKLTYSKVTVRTSDRLLTFETSGSTWKEFRLH